MKKKVQKNTQKYPLKITEIHYGMKKLIFFPFSCAQNFFLVAIDFELGQSSTKKLSVPKDLNNMSDDLVEPKKVCIPQFQYPRGCDLILFRLP